MTASWPLVRLEELVSIKHGFAFKGDFFSEDPSTYCLVTPGNFAIGGGFKLDKLKFYNGPIPEEYILRPDDLIVTMTDLSKKGDTLGYSALVPNDSRYCFLHNQRIGLVSVISENVNKHYLYFVLRSHEYRNHVLGSATGSTVKHTSPSKIASYEFRLPPLATQDWIGNILMSFEKKIQVNQDSNQTLEQIAQALFKSWFVTFDPVKAKMAALEAGGTAEDAERAAIQAISGKSEAELDSLKSENPDQYDSLARTAALFPSTMVESELGEIPEGWEFRSISDFAYLKGGKQLKKENIFAAGRFPVFGGAGVMGYTEVNNADGNLICIGRVGAYCGQVFYHPGKAWINNNATHVDPVYPAIACWLFKSISNADFESVKRGAAQPFISNGDMANLQIVWGGNAVAQDFENTVRPLFDMAYNNESETFYLAELRDTLLPKLLSGELTVPDAADETPEAANG